MPRQMRPLMCTSPLLIQFQFTGRAGVGGGTTPGFSKMTTPGLMSSTRLTLISESCPNWQLDRTNTVSIDVKAVDGLAYCERAARSQAARRQHMPQITTELGIATNSPGVKPALPPPLLSYSFTI